MIYNANLDRSQSNRKSKQELKRELKKWEDDKPKKKKPTVEDSLAHEVSIKISSYSHHSKITVY